MQLSKIEIKGFKSFGDSAKVLFDKGVTGIVGPNGCGKSNVVDAIRWVLGEQKTKSLRSDKMENIIFNGTKKRKPAQTAQVSLTFDNDRGLIPSEYTQVTITRRYHRTGESEYMINEVRCRLKDISDLFLDTGIGSDSYAIIELKKVDEILNDKLYARRDLFEKAAGISKFKTRKKESFSRLEAVDKDLARVGDLLFEIEKNLKSLERQAKQAERYFKLQGKYRQASLIYARKAVSRQADALESLRTKIQVETETRQGIQARLVHLDTELDTEKTQLDHFEKNLAFKQKLLNEHKAKIRNIENEKKLKHERIHFLHEKIDTIRRQINEDLQNQTRLKNDIRQFTEEKNSLEKILNESELELAELKTTYDDQKAKTQEIQRKLKVNEELLNNKQNEINQLNRQIEVKQTRLSSSKQELENIVQQNNQLRDEFHTYELELEKTTTSLEIAKRELTELQYKEERKASEVQELEQEIEEIRTQYDRQKRLLDAKKNEFDLTKSLVDNMEGFPEAIKFLQKNSQWAQSIPLLSDIITCHEKYRTAIENYLDPWINYYIVNTQWEAFKAIDLLQKSQKGKANFFILEFLENPENEPNHTHLNPEASLFFGGLSPAEIKSTQSEHAPIPALDIVNFDPEHEALVDHLLKDLYIITHSDDIREMPVSEKNYVTLQGEVIRRQFSLTGGSIGSFEGKRIGRIKNLEKLESEIQELDKVIHELRETLTFKQSNLQSLKQNKSLKEAYQQTGKHLNEINEKYVALRSKKEQLSQIIESNFQRNEEIQHKIAEVTQEIERLSPQMQEEQEVFHELEDQIYDLREQFEFESESLSVQSSRYNELNIKYHQQQNLIDNLDQKIGYQENSTEEVKERLSRLEADLKQAETDLEVLLESQENYDENLLALEAQSESYELNVQSAEKDYYSLRAKIADSEKESKNLQHQKDQSDNILQELNHKLHETQLSLTGIRERLSVEFQVDLDELLQKPLEELQEGEEVSSEQELKEQIDGLRQKMERIGSINPMALEAYEEMKQRFDVISKQKADLIESKQSLLKIIHEMEEYARTAFMEAYEKIRANFTRVFRSLFSAEDKADLILSDPNDPLESHINIVAQPKGKRPLTIDQLSGGEKTLTAISLLFALYLLKPAPFCIFDEVDAPLDDANTDKFNNIIREFSKDSQFILVTHNKRTMSMADILYGVTMIEDGVSSVVPVDLRQIEMQEAAR